MNKLIPDVKLTLERFDVSTDPQDDKNLFLILKPSGATATYEYQMKRADFVQWLSDKLDQLDQHPYQEILATLKRIEDKLPT